MMLPPFGRVDPQNRPMMCDAAERPSCICILREQRNNVMSNGEFIIWFFVLMLMVESMTMLVV
jgi:hypothetical protein